MNAACHGACKRYVIITCLVVAKIAPGNVQILMDNGAGRPKDGSILYLFGVICSIFATLRVIAINMRRIGRNNKGQLASATCALKDEVATISYPCFPDTRFVPLVPIIPLPRLGHYRVYIEATARVMAQMHGVVPSIN